MQGRSRLRGLLPPAVAGGPGQSHGGFAASLDAVLSETRSETRASRPLTRVGAQRDKFPPAPTFL